MLHLDEKELALAVTAAIMASMPEPTPEAAKEACDRAEAWIAAYRTAFIDARGPLVTRF